MQNKYLFSIATLTLIILLAACGNKKEASVPVPGVVTLLSPADNTSCLKIASSGNTASLTFSWGAASNAASYRVDIVNLKTQTTTSYNTTLLSYNTNFDVGMPYSWKVTAINPTGETSSNLWKFYLAGVASSSYAPFPADLISPVSGAVVNANGTSTVTVSFQWKASDPDNDIANYTLFLDNTDASKQVLTSLTTVSATQILDSGKTYYWKILTTDKTGNSSTSAVNSFQIK